MSLKPPPTAESASLTFSKACAICSREISLPERELVAAYSAARWGGARLSAERARALLRGLDRALAEEQITSHA